jgi:hypothetical protein
MVGNTEIMRWTVTIRPTGISGTGEVRFQCSIRCKWVYPNLSQ